MTDAILVRAPVGVVYRTLSDLDAWSGWHASCTSDRLAAHPDRPGDHHRLVLPLGRRSWSVDLVVDGWRHDSGLRWTLAHPLVASTEWWLEGRPEGTVVHHLLHDIGADRRSVARALRHRRAVMLAMQAMKDHLELAVALAAGSIP